MSHGRSDAEIVRDTHNTARFFVENSHIAWVLLITTCVAGLFAYARMPKLKDPSFPIIYAAAVCPWPGVPADRIESLVTRRMEERIAENARVVRIESTTRGSVAIVIFKVDEDTEDPAKEFDDIAQRLAGRFETGGELDGAVEVEDKDIHVRVLFLQFGKLQAYQLVFSQCKGVVHGALNGLSQRDTVSSVLLLEHGGLVSNG